MLRAKTMRDVDPRHWDVVIRDKGKCQYCGLDGTQDIRILGSFQLDHLIPWFANGTDDLDNLVLSCPLCNRDKGRWDPSRGSSKPPARKVMIKRARRYINARGSRYYKILYEALNSR